MKNNFWHRSANTGLIIGALAIAAMFLGFILTNLLQLQDKALAISISLLDFFKFVVVVTILWRATALYAQSLRKEEFTIAQGIGFVVMTMVFAGFLDGIGYYIQFVKLQPDYISDTVDQMLQGKEEAAMVTKRLLSSVVYWIMLAMFKMAFYGVLIGLFISVIIRRRLAATDQNQINDSHETEYDSDETVQ